MLGWPFLVELRDKAEDGSGNLNAPNSAGEVNSWVTKFDYVKEADQDPDLIRRMLGFGDHDYQKGSVTGP